MCDHNQRLMRWSLIVQGYNLEVRHKKGSENAAAVVVSAGGIFILFSFRSRCGLLLWVGVLRPSRCLYVCSVLLCACLSFSFPSFSLPVSDWLPPPSPRHRCTSAHPSLSRIGCRHHSPAANALHSTNHLSVRPHLNPVLCTVQ